MQYKCAREESVPEILTECAFLKCSCITSLIMCFFLRYVLGLQNVTGVKIRLRTQNLQVPLNYQLNGTSGQLPATASLLTFGNSKEIIWQQLCPQEWIPLSQALLHSS